MSLFGVCLFKNIPLHYVHCHQNAIRYNVRSFDDFDQITYVFGSHNYEHKDHENLKQKLFNWTTGDTTDMVRLSQPDEWWKIAQASTGDNNRGRTGLDGGLDKCGETGLEGGWNDENGKEQRDDYGGNDTDILWVFQEI